MKLVNPNQKFLPRVFFLVCPLLFVGKVGAQVLSLDQGWDAADRATAHQLDVGAEIMPARWFFALESANSTEKFSSQLQKLGFINSKAGELPIGVTVSEDSLTEGLYGEKKWVGVNCAACHTNLLEVNGKKILIEGNQSLFRLQEFESSVVDNVTATLTDDAKFDRFAQDLKTESEWDLFQLRRNLTLFRDEFRDANLRSRHFQGQNGKDIAYGPGRLDGIGSASNALTCHLTDRQGGNTLLAGFVTDEQNCRPSNPPVSIPHLWGMTNMQYAQWNVDVHSSLGRNVGAIMAGYGRNWVELDLKGNFKFKTTAHVENIVRFEELYQKLKTPRWNEMAQAGVVPPLNPDQVYRGQQLYASKCIQCHSVQPQSTKPNAFGNSYWKINSVPAAEVGTEEKYLLVENQGRGKVPKFLKQSFRDNFGDKIFGPDGTVPISAYRGLIAGATLKSYFADHQTPTKKILKMTNCRENSLQTVLGFKARSLEGVVWTAPYLHNGSVPNLLELLTSAKARAKTFFVGCPKYDAKTAGYDCNKDSENAFLFDTSLEGNRNIGHEYGTELEPSQKLDLIEYLKSLVQPANPSPQNPDCH